MNSNIVELAQCIATIVATIVNICLVGIVAKQLKAQRRQTKSDSLEKLHRDLIGEEIQYAMRVVFSVKPGDFLETDDLNLIDAAEKVLNHYDLIGHRARTRTIPRKSTIETEWQVVLRLAQQLYPFIELQELKRGGEYKAGFKYLLDMVKKDRNCARALATLRKQNISEESITGKIQELRERIGSERTDRTNPFTGMVELPVTPLKGFNYGSKHESPATQ